MEREAGYYWVKLNEVWFIGEYFNEENEWSVFGFNYSYAFEESLFSEIDERRIERIS